ncbi:MAG: lipoate--protein ligase family protein [Desulfobacteraceae bacterium]|nr:MAG: lipoate--protein ligase family protein [Desulfobacteraceae bacterium]
METWRFLEVDWLSYAQTAIYRPVLMRAVSEEIVPETFSFCTFPVPSLVLNFLNDPEKEINLDFCMKKGIPVYRVISSGGPIFGDTGYIFTFLHMKRSNPKAPPDAPAMFEKTLTGIAKGISDHFGVECRFRPLNDVEVRCEDGIWRKIGPSSCVYEEKAIQMGSGIQVKAPDSDLIASAIAAPPEKFVDKEAKSIQERITYLEKVVGRNIDLSEIRDLYLRQMENVFDVKLVLGELEEKEKDYYRAMEREYTNNEFFMERSEAKFGILPPGVERKMIQFKVPGGPFMRIIVLREDDRIRDLLISGTVHASPLRPTSPVHEIEKALKGQPLDIGLFESKIEQILSRKGFQIAKVSSDFLAQKIYECAVS